MIPRYLYEALPYLYLGSGSLCLLSSERPLLWLSGLLLYAAGALAWVTRAQYRRRHNRRLQPPGYPLGERALGRPPPRQRLHLPERLYEYLPFLYLLAGCVGYQYYQLVSASYTAVVAIVLFGAAGGCTWVMRGYYRGYHRQPVTAASEG